MAFREQKKFGEEFNPFTGLRKLKGPKTDDVVGRSRGFILENAIEGCVVIGREAHIFDNDAASLLSVEEKNVIIRPFSAALGTLFVLLEILKETTPLDITCQIRVEDVVLIGRNDWVWDNTADREQGGLFSRFFIPGNYDIYTQLVVDTDLKNPNSTLHRMQFKFNIKSLPEELINRHNTTAFSYYVFVPLM
ncbi:hypothetical protein HYT18_03855 [Candidatus Microgenomates bacterium]|nr:hypothetical protein [Candidatus Microgenomates bacterium]